MFVQLPAFIKDHHLLCRPGLPELAPVSHNRLVVSAMAPPDGRPFAAASPSSSVLLATFVNQRPVPSRITSGPDTRRAGCGSAQPNPGWLSSRTLPPPAASPTSVTKMQPAPSFEFSSAKSAPPAEPQETELFSTGWQIDLHVECCLAVVDTTFAVHRPLC